MRTGHAWSQRHECVPTATVLHDSSKLERQEGKTLKINKFPFYRTLTLDEPVRLKNPDDLILSRQWQK